MLDILLWLIFAGLCATFYHFYSLVRKNEQFFADRGIPFEKPKFLFGSAREFFFKKIELIEFLEDRYNTMPNERVSGFFNLMSPVFLVRDPELFKRIAIKEFDSFEDHKFIIEPHMDSMMGNTLFLMRGQTWRKMRATLSPAFTGSKMRHMFGLIRKCAAQSCESLLDQSSPEEHEIELTDFFGRFTNDVIASAAFGLNLNSFKDKNNEFFLTGRKLGELAGLGTFLRIMMLRTVPRLMKILNIGVVEGPVRRLFTDLVLNNLKTRREQSITRPDMIDILMNATRNIPSLDDKTGVDEKRTWSDEEIVSQAFVFFLAGFDTIMWMLTSFAYELALHPDIQQRLIDEVDATDKALNGADVTYDDLKKMKYMEMVLNEVLRFHSPATSVDRLCTKNFTLKDGDLNIQFVKGDLLWAPIRNFHFDPDYFPEPKKFNPERFSDENKANINPAHFIPFGQGPRQCIGNRFALMEVKVLIYYLLKRFTINVSVKTEIPMTVKSSFFGLAAGNGLHLILKKRP